MLSLMENVLIQGLDDVLKNVKNLKSMYQVLASKNQDLENKISILKVESEIQKQEILRIKKESEDREVGAVKSATQTSTNPSEEIEALKKDQNEKNAQIKLQLDGFIEDIDQCIQIIQAKE